MGEKSEEISEYYFVLLDTCTASNIFNQKWGSVEKTAFASSMGFDTRIAISDLSFSEMSLGRKDLNSFNGLAKDLSDCEFLIVGRDQKLKQLIDKNSNKYAYSQLDMDQFRAKIRENTDRVRAQLFTFVAIDYCILFFLVLENIDKTFFGGTRKTFHYFASRGIAQRFIRVYFSCHKDQEGGNLLFGIAVIYLKMMLVNIKTSKEIDGEIAELGLPRSLSKKTNMFIEAFKKEHSMSKRKRN